MLILSIFWNPLCYSLLSMILVLLLFFLKWLNNTERSNKNYPPSPQKLPLIGNLHQLGRFPHRSLRSLSQKHGPIMFLQLGAMPTVVVSSPEAAREIMKTYDLVFSDRPKLIVAKKLLYDFKDVSMAPYGEFWRRIKSIYMVQLLSNKRVQYYRKIREEEVALMVKEIWKLARLGLPVNLSEMFLSLTNNVICRAALGRKYGEGRNGKKIKGLLSDFVKLMGDGSIGDFIPWLSWVSKISGFDAKVDRVGKGLDEFLQGIVEGRINGVENEENRDFINILLQIYMDGSGGSSFDKDCIKAQILIAFAAGTDTTYTFLEWAMAELLKNPRVMKELQNEVRQILCNKPDIVEEDLEKMKYLKATIKETLRLHPSVPLLVPRVAREDTNVMGYNIDAGTMVITNSWAIGRDPMYWAEPDEFKPERFLSSCIDFRGHDFEFIPFGAGRRGCPGIGFATAVGEIVLANLVHKFDWDLPGGVKAENLDMSESRGAMAQKKKPLLAIATSYKTNVSDYDL